MKTIEKIKKLAVGLNKKIIFPEGEDERILKAVENCVKKKMIKAVLVGDEKRIMQKAKSLKISLNGVEIVNPLTSDKLEQYTSIYSDKIKISQIDARDICKRPLVFSAIALAAGDVDGMIGGAVHTSREVIGVSKHLIGLQEGISVASSFFIMDIPGFKGGEDGSLLYADASVNPNPTSEELADIAIISGHTAKNLFGWKPRIAMLSFSTKGSAKHPDIDKVRRATEIAKRRAQDMAIDGELQADSALVMETAKRKIGKAGEVGGRANILIFPDLDAGNICYKLTEILAKADAYGPVLQGFAKPVSDLSRGSTVEDIEGVIAIISFWAKRYGK